MNKTALISEEPAVREVSCEASMSGVCTKRRAPDGRGARTALMGESTAQLTDEPITPADMRAVLSDALAECAAGKVEVASALPEWVELRVPCDLAAMTPLQKLLARLDADLAPEIGEAISYAFREMLSNAVEYGGRLDPAKRVEVRFLRLKRTVYLLDQRPWRGLRPRAP